MASPPERTPTRRPTPFDLLPPIDDLRRLDDIVPDATKRLLQAFEAQSQHRQNWEMRSLELHAQERRRAQLFAFIFALAGLGTSAFLGWLGYPTTAGVVGGTTVCGVVTTFILGSRRKVPPDELAPPPGRPPQKEAA